MKFAIVGPISKDHIVLASGDKIEKFGAVAYSAIALANMLEGTADRVICLSHISQSDLPEVASLLNHPNIDLSGLTIFPDSTGTTEIKLTYTNQNERNSRQIHSIPPIIPSELELLADCEAILLMPLNDTDIPLNSLQKLRQSSSAFIFVDVHGLVTGVDQYGRRFNQPWLEATDWLQCINVLKMNAKEAQWVSGRVLEAPEEFAEYAAEIVAAGLDACWITFGDQSSLIAWRREERVFWSSVPVLTGIGPVLDTTGCGDVATSGFVYSYSKYHNALISVILGNTLGSLKASLEERQTFPSTLEIRGIIYHHYRDYLHALLDDFLTKSQLITHEIKGGPNLESTMFHSDGGDYHYGTNHEGDRHRQSPPTPWT